MKNIVDTLTPALDRVVGFKSLWRKVLRHDPDWNPVPDMDVRTEFDVFEDGDIKLRADNLTPLVNERLVEQLTTGIEWSKYPEDNFQGFFKDFARLVREDEGYILLNGQHTYPWLRKWGCDHLEVFTSREVLPRRGQMAAFGRFTLLVSPHVAPDQLLVVPRGSGRYSDKLSLALVDPDQGPLVRAELRVTMEVDATKVRGVQVG